MKYFLKDYTGKKHPVNIPEGTKEVAGIDVSGDEIMVYPVFRDPMYVERDYDYLEGSWHKVLSEDGIWEDKEEQL